MSPRKQNLQEFLDESFSRFREMPTDNVDSACYRVLQRLRTEPQEMREAIVTVPRTARRYRRLAVLIAAAAMSVVFAQQLIRRPAPSAPVPAPPLAPQTAVLQQPQPVEPPKPAPVTPPRPLQFAAASIRVMPPRTGAAGFGLACHGTDGVKRVVLTISPGRDGVSAPQGRCVGTGIFLSTLIEMAYGVSMFDMSGGPDWSRTAGRTIYLSFGSQTGALTSLGGWPTPQGPSWSAAESFHVEAVAENPGTATLEQLRQMLQGMLADRFKLQHHFDQKEVPGYSLVVAEGGHKMKPISGEYVESLVIYDGRSTMEQFADSLRMPAGGLVIDKTGLQGPFEYKLIQTPPTGGGRGGLEPGGRGPGLSADLEKQLGLRLQAEKAVPIKVLVIDSVEKPTPN